ncbi:hypothetical protein ABPG75_006077 [Micractinium tetrahymenae]
MRLPPYPAATARPNKPAGGSRLPKAGAAPSSHLRVPSSASSSAAGWGFAMSAPEPAEEQCAAATPCASPVVTPEKLPPAGRTAAALADNAADSAPPAAPAPTAYTIPADTRAALQQLAGRLGAAASSGSMPPHASFEEAFLAGVTVGLVLPVGGRRARASTMQRALLAVVLAGVLLVLGGSALLLAGVAQAHPTVYYQ